MIGMTEFFASFSVDDLDAAQRFYAGTLGLDVSVTTASSQWLRELWLLLDGRRRVMIYPKPDHTPPACTVLNFPVDDIGKVVDDLVAAGVAIDTFPAYESDGRGIHRVGDHSIAWFHDPAGNVLAIDEKR